MGLEITEESYLGLLVLGKLVFKGPSHPLELRPPFLWLEPSGLTAGAKGDKARPLLGVGKGLTTRPASKDVPCCI